MEYLILAAHAVEIGLLYVILKCHGSQYHDSVSARTERRDIRQQLNSLTRIRSN